MKKYKKILIVCTGNSCRSPMAEALLKHMLGNDEEEISVTSAGISAPEGLNATLHSINIMKQKGIEISTHRTRRLTQGDINRADLILVMGKSHKNAVIRMDPNASSKTFLLGCFGTEEGSVEIFDPIGMPLERYEYCFELIEKSLNEVIKEIQ